MVNSAAPRPRSWARRLATLAAAALLLAVAGCGGIIPVPVPVFEVTAFKTKEIQIQVSPWANEDNPVAVDVLIIYDEDMMDRLGELPARQWFRQRDQFRRDFPSGYEALEWELVPGQRVDPTPMPHNAATAVGSFVFANYYTDGDHRARLDQIDNVLIRLGEKGFTIESVNE